MSLTTMSAWHDFARHPWYAPATLKRKHSDSEDDDDVADAYLRGSSHSPDSDTEHTVAVGYPTPPPETALLAFTELEHGERGHSERKRRRYGEIERRMARMHIAPPLGLVPSMSAGSEASWYTAGSTSPVLRENLLAAYAVEEPTSPEFDGRLTVIPDTDAGTEVTPPTHEVRMKGTEPAWYEREKDRIVITDLDEAAEEDEYKSEAEPHPDASEYSDSNADYSISSLLLDHIKNQANFPYVPPSLNDKSKNGALVLFRPPPTTFFARPGATEEEIREADRRQEDRRTVLDGVHVEEVDVDASNAPPGGYVIGTVSESNDGYEPMEMDIDP